MTPLTIAEKWTRAAIALWDNSHTSDPQGITLTQRVRAHYGNHRPALHEIIAVAMLEAMNEWHQLRDETVCESCEHVRCAQARQNA